MAGDGEALAMAASTSRVTTRSRSGVAEASGRPSRSTSARRRRQHEQLGAEDVPATASSTAVHRGQCDRPRVPQRSSQQSEDARRRRRAWGFRAHQSSGSTSTRSVPPQVRPTAKASSSEYPNVHTRAVARLQHRERFGDDRSLDAAARHRAGDLSGIAHRHRRPDRAGRSPRRRRRGRRPLSCPCASHWSICGSSSFIPAPSPASAFSSALPTSTGLNGDETLRRVQIPGKRRCRHRPCSRCLRHAGTCGQRRLHGGGPHRHRLPR